jgi:hypothetical protein
MYDGGGCDADISEIPRFIQEEASARRWRYWAVLEASYSPIGGR